VSPSISVLNFVGVFEKRTFRASGFLVRGVIMDLKRSVPLCALPLLAGCALAYPPLPPTNVAPVHVDEAPLTAASTDAANAVTLASAARTKLTDAKREADTAQVAALAALGKARTAWLAADAAADAYDALPKKKKAKVRPPARRLRLAAEELDEAGRRFEAAKALSKQTNELLTSATAQYETMRKVSEAADARLVAARKSNRTPLNLDAVLKTASDLQSTYGTRYSEAGKTNDVLQLPVISAAALAANRVLNGTRAGADQADAARDLGKIGIIVTTFTAARGALWPANLSRIYADGYNAAGCVMARGTEVKSLALDMDDFNTRRATLAQKILELENYLPSIDSSVASDLVAENKLADQELANARKVQSSAGLEARAYEQSAGAFQSAISALAFRIVARALVRQSADYRSLKEDLYKPPTQPTAPDAPKSELNALAAKLSDFGGDKAAYLNVIRPELISLIEALASARAALEAGMPNYVDRLEALKGCLDLAGPAPSA